MGYSVETTEANKGIRCNVRREDCRMKCALIQHLLPLGKGVGKPQQILSGYQCKVMRLTDSPNYHAVA